MIRALKILICPNCTLVDFIDITGEKSIFLQILVIQQDGKGMIIDMNMNLTFGFDDYFFKWI